ncbi:hypothetical protein BDB01DRAFT_813518 [Pilobolus umbonatus]|nr:hypothetical protein BDB01DRAFT_813518 [Pilobolus umbonatus]
MEVKAKTPIMQIDMNHRKHPPTNAMTNITHSNTNHVPNNLNALTLPTASTHHHSANSHNNHHEDTILTCHWKDCLQLFPNHTSLAAHLSEDHVGWKKGGYYCEWTNCARQGAKCHNRFALMMHLRIHTGEKPFECTYPNCDQTFGRMDALVRHKKAEHGEETVEKPNKHPAVSRPRKILSKKIPIENLNKARRKRPNEMSNKEDMDIPTTGYYYEDDSGNSSDELEIMPEPKDNTTSDKLNATPGSTDYIQYRLVKAQLHYILRENEMLRDELDIAQKKLKRMRTERMVLLEAVMNAEQNDNKYQDDLLDEDDIMSDSDRLKREDESNVVA